MFKNRIGAPGALCLVAAALGIVLSSPGIIEARPATTTNKISSVSPVRKAPNNLNQFGKEDSGSLSAITPSGKPLGKCPLKHTDVTAEISGFVSRVKVVQQFENPFPEKIEAIYTFPLSETGAVDEMLMKVGKRTIRGEIKKREEAREIYERAKAHGQTASLLDQERTNIFTQSVANIKPGEIIEITISYVDLLPYEAGNFSFVFPTVVGPRFIPGESLGKQGTGWANDTSNVPDASRITPPVTPKCTRAGHDISISVDIDAGVPILDLNSKVHEVDITKTGDRKAKVTLKDRATIPNKDFVFSWQVAADKLKSGYLTHRVGDKGYFSLMILPPKRVTPETVAPKEMIFLIDCSGSQSGAPLEKAKETMSYILDHMNANDTFQVISFSDHLNILFDKPEKADSEMRAQARKFIAGLSANGGTWMAPAVEKACAIPSDDHRLRIVTFMTDGYVGNDFEIIGLVKKLRGNSRWFPFGTGSSVNRMLIDMMAKEGGGEAEYVLLNSSGADVGRKFYERISSPVLTDVKVNFGGLAVKDVFPHEVSDVWAEKPLYIKGLYTKPGTGTVTISGYQGGKPYTEKLTVNFPAKEIGNAVLGSIWARAKVDQLMSADWFGAQQGSVKDELKKEIVATALQHHIMTQYTSFVAVEEKTVQENGKPKTVVVPVEMPEGVSYEGVFGESSDACKLGSAGSISYRARSRNACIPPPPSPSYSASAGGSIACYSAGLGAGSVTAARRHESRVYKKTEVDLEMKDAGMKSKDLSKLDKSLMAVLAAYSQGVKDGKAAGIQISNGTINVRILVASAGADVLAKLVKLGLQNAQLNKHALVVTGVIAVEKLDELVDLKDVLYVRAAN